MDLFRSSAAVLIDHEQGSLVSTRLPKVLDFKLFQTLVVVMDFSLLFVYSSSLSIVLHYSD